MGCQVDRLVILDEMLNMTFCDNNRSMIIAPHSLGFNQNLDDIFKLREVLVQNLDFVSPCLLCLLECSPRTTLLRSIYGSRLSVSLLYTTEISSVGYWTGFGSILVLYFLVLFWRSFLYWLLQLSVWSLMDRFYWILSCILTHLLLRMRRCYPRCKMVDPSKALSCRVQKYVLLACL